MRVLLLLPYAWDTAPSQRFRVEQWVSRLRMRGVEFRIETLLTLVEQRLLYGKVSTARKVAMLVVCVVRRIKQILGRGHYDAVWLHRAALPVGPPLLERTLAGKRVPLILEFDDAIYLTDTAQANRRWAFLKCSTSKTAQLCRMSDAVVVGNDYLAAYARQFNPKVAVIPTTIDTDLYRPRSVYPERTPVVVGWSGSRTTVAHLRLLDRAIQKAAALFPLRLHVIGTPAYPLEGVDTYASDWRSEAELAELGKFDLGVMPLPDEEWARGKCGLKALQYMALGIPTVASPVGVNGEIIKDGVNGFLPHSEDEWVERLVALTRDVRLREQVGRAGRRTVEERYSAEVGAKRALELLTAVCTRGGSLRTRQRNYTF